MYYFSRVSDEKKCYLPWYFPKVHHLLFGNVYEVFLGWGCVKVWDIWRADRRRDKFGSRVGIRSPRDKSKFTQLAHWSEQRAKSKAYAASLEISSSGLWLLCSSHTLLSPLFPLFSHTIQVYSCSDRSS